MDSRAFCYVPCINAAADTVTALMQDVVKTRTQLADDGRPRRILPTLREVARDEGLRGLFAGGVPRAIRAAPSCAIVLASYELIKAAFVPEAAEQLQCKQ